MDGNKILEVVGVYREYFKSLGVLKRSFSYEYLIMDEISQPWDMLSHCHGMLDKMEVFVKEGKIDKAFRWLGFIQGCLWSTGHFTLEDLKNHSRPNPPT